MPSSYEVHLLEVQTSFGKSMVKRFETFNFTEIFLRIYIIYILMLENFNTIDEIGICYAFGVG